MALALPDDHLRACARRVSRLLVLGALDAAPGKSGHDVVAMDLPLEDGAATFDTYADIVCAALGDRGDDVVLVGHSYAGNTIPLVAARRPLRHLVYLCAMIPDIGQPRRSIG